MTPFGRSLEGAADRPKRMSAAKPNSNRSPMNAVKPAAPAHGRIAEQVPAFAAIGLIGYVVDAAITFVGAKYLGLSPELARPPGFIIATIVNFAPQPVDHLPPCAGAADRLVRPLFAGRFGRSGGQLRRLFGLRRSRAARRDRRHAGDPAAVRRRRQRGRDGADLRRLSVLRLSPLRMVNFARPIGSRARYGCAEAPWSSARCPFRPTTAISTAIPPIFSR